MISKLDRDRFLDMLHYAKAAVRLAAKQLPEGTEAYEDAFLGLCRAVELIGEAAGQVSDAGKAILPELEWREAIAMRHRLIHGYFSIRPEVVFETARDDLPQMIVALERALGESPL
jgi:uncharacterized protein with HEPN domain